MTDKMQIYNAARSVPADAVKTIKGGAYGVAGLSDINPQWRIEEMTRLFGPIGVGWVWEPIEEKFENGHLYARVAVRYKGENGAWSEPVYGNGGTKLSGKDDSDVYKSTTTDAISNALRYLGIGADVWYKPGSKCNQFDTKYSTAPAPKVDKPQQPARDSATPEQLAFIAANFTPDRIDAMLKHYRVPSTDMLTYTEAEMVIRKRKKELMEV